MTRAVLASLLGALASLAPACSYPTDQPMYDPTAAGGAQPFHVVSSQPKNGAANVPLGAAVTVVFSDFPDPAVIAPFGAIQIRSGQNNFDHSTSVDLVGRSVTMQLPPGRSFNPTTQYTVLVTTMMRSLAGVALDPAVAIAFTTGTTAGGGPTPPPVRTLAADVQPLFDADCATRGCHDAATASAGLNLASGAAASHLVGIPSSEMTSLARVKVNDPAASYLLRKLLGTPDIVLGRMPPKQQADAPWSDDRIRVVSDWIETGAR